VKKEIVIISVFVLIGLAGLGLFIGFYDSVFPTASLDFKISRPQALEKAREFIASQGFDLKDYQETIVFNHDYYAQIYMERSIGLKEANRLMRQEISVWYWRVRWFKPLEKEEFIVRLDPGGRVVGYSHLLTEDAQGANLAEAQGLKIAQAFLSGNGNFNLAEYELMEVSKERRKNRTDHYFNWKKKDFQINEADYRLAVTVQGNRVDAFKEYLKVPETFKRTYKKIRSRAGLLSQCAWFLHGVLFIGLIIVFLFKLRTNDIRWRWALVLAGAVLVVTLVSSINSLSLARAVFSTEVTLGNQIIRWIFRALFTAFLAGVVIWFIGSSGETLYREVFSRKTLLLRSFKWKNILSPEFTKASLVGYSFGFAFLGYLVVFYLVSKKFLGAWAPAYSPYSNIVSTALPWIYPLTVGVIAAVNEEFFFRLFAISFLKKYLKKIYLAVIIPAVIWAFLHSTYAVEPIYIRGVELTIAGVAFGIVFLRFGLLSVLIAHYVIDALVVGLPLLRSESSYFFISGLIVVGLALLPIVPVLFRWGRRKG
jgi:membrane protease YdiL (CAAX protease family)